MTKADLYRFVDDLEKDGDLLEAVKPKATGLASLVAAANEHGYEAAPNARSISTMSWGLLQKPIEQIGRVSRQVMAVVVRKIVEGGKPLAAFGFLHRRFQPFVRKRQL